MSATAEAIIMAAAAAFLWVLILAHSEPMPITWAESHVEDHIATFSTSQGGDTTEGEKLLERLTTAIREAISVFMVGDTVIVSVCRPMVWDTPYTWTVKTAGGTVYRIHYIKCRRS